MKLEDFSPMEQLAIAQGLYKKIAEVVSTKDLDSLRSRIDGEVIRDYLDSGIKSRDVRVNGEKVGTYSVRISKAKTEDVLSEIDHDAFVKWAGENPEICTLFALNQAAKLVQFALETTGEIPDGYEIVEVVTPEDLSGTTLKVDAGKVEQAVGSALPDAVAGFMEGGSNG